VLASLEWLPLPLANRLALVYARLLDMGVPRLRRIALRNLSFARPDLSAQERRRIADGVFRSIARLLVSFSRFPRMKPEDLGKRIRCEGMEHVQKAKECGKGVLFATAHLGNWELSAFAYAWLAEPMQVVVRPLDNPLLDRIVEQRRGMSGNRLIEKRDFARSILTALRENQAVGVLTDQNSSIENGVFVNFFGIPACAGTGLARLAARSGAAVIPGFAIWSEEEKRYVLHFDPPISISGEAGEDTQAIQRHLESVIRCYPDQWLWIHRRWKTRPRGSPALYE
jgi:KDO2-lipid IV(A) lauroyltransferase